MPQLNINDFAPQLVWLAISFIALYLIMSRLALPRIGQIIEERSCRIEGDLAAAARLREDTEQAITAYEQALAEAKGRAQGIARQSRDYITRDIERQRAEVDQQITARTTEAESRIKTLKDSALEHVGEIASDTAEALVARLLGKSPNRSELQVAVNEALGK
jgi:F-type H+-transporting ATPase subunit b